MTMDIIVNKINEIDTTYSERTTCLKISVELSDYQREKIFYDLWEYLEDDGLRKLIEAEGYKLKKVNEK